ncbi:MAG: HesA/MoeB/ThiF family protein [Bacteroidales bacterium]|nr:HesA/MoeB/ThiF family protein [Bacteroidales bacterium]
MFEFSEEEIKRYARHILLKEVGEEGQEKIRNAKVLVVGAGGLGSPVILYLAAAGIGTLGIIDGDNVDLSNLQRQIIHSADDLGRAKALSAKQKVNTLNPHVKVVVYQDFLTSNNAMGIIKEYDFVVGCTDNFSAKLLINDVCVKAGKPFSHGGISEFEGQTFTYVPGHCCYRCIFDMLPENTASTGVFGAIAGMLGTIQAAETLKYFTGVGELLCDKLLIFDAKTMNFRKISISKRNNCTVCGEKKIPEM